jgi:hypothetical protein
VASVATRVQIHCTLDPAPGAAGHGCNQSGMQAWVTVIPASVRLPAGSCELHSFMVGLIADGGAYGTPKEAALHAARRCAGPSVEYRLEPGVDLQPADVVDDFMCTD